MTRAAVLPLSGVGAGRERCAGLALLVFLSAAVACGGPTDALPDAAAGVPDAAAVEPLGALAGVAVRWDAPLALCSYWQGEDTLEWARAVRVKIDLPAEVRVDLSRASLSAARLAGVWVARGPFSADQWADVVAESSSVERFVVVDRGVWTLLDATIVHALGPAGALRESYLVTRAPGDATPVVVSEATSPPEVTFAWSPPDHPERRVALRPCAGDPSFDEDAVSVLVGTNEERSVIVTRFWRTDADAPDAAIGLGHLVAHRVRFSGAVDDPTQYVPRYELEGPWAQTVVRYGANGEERTRLDLTEDLVWSWALRPEGLDRASRAPQVTAVDARGIGVPGEAAALDVERVPRWSGEGAREEFELVAPAWRRVDAAALRRELLRGCPEGSVSTLVAEPGYAFQAVTCPRTTPPGMKLVGVVPLVFPRDPHLVAERFGRSVVSEIRTTEGTAFHVELARPASPAAEFSVDLAPLADGTWRVEVRHAAGGTIAEATAAPTTLGPSKRRREVLSGGDEDGRVHVELVRQGLGWDMWASSIHYAPESLSLEVRGVTYRVVAWDALTYENTHRNREDELLAMTPEGVRLHWKTHFGMDTDREWHHEVWAEDAEGGEVLPRTSVTLKPSVPP